MFSLAIPDYCRKLVGLLVVVLNNDDRRAVAHALVHRDAAHIHRILKFRFLKGLAEGLGVHGVEVVGQKGTGASLVLMRPPFHRDGLL